MDKVKTLLRIGGILIAAVGGMLLPIRNYVFDKGDQSAFGDVTELGGFVHAGFAIIVAGLVLFGLSFLVRGDLTD